MPGGVPEGGFVALVFRKWRSAQRHPAPDYAFGQDDEEAVAPPQDHNRSRWEGIHGAWAAPAANEPTLRPAQGHETLPTLLTPPRPPHRQ